MDRKVLYLDGGGRVLRVSREGPALRVETSDGATRWYPLQRVSRVVSRGRVLWEGHGLHACIEAGISVLMVDEEGGVRGLCVGALHDMLGLREHLENCMAGPSWMERYTAWRRAQERRLIRHACAALGWECTDLRPTRVQARMDQTLARRWGSRGRTRLRELHALAVGQAAEALSDAGLDPDQALGWQGAVSLAADLGALLGWPVRGRLLAANAGCPSDGRALAALYQAILERPLAATARRLVSYLWRIDP